MNGIVLISADTTIFELCTAANAGCSSIEFRQLRLLWKLGVHSSP